MKPFVRICLVILLALSLAQVAGAQWECLYVTLDNSANGTGNRTTGVGVIKEDMFVAMCTRPDTYAYMIPYVNADSLLGRKYFYGYGSEAYPTGTLYEVWTDGGFDQVTFLNAWTIKARPDSLIYIANNDADHNVLVYKYANDTLSVVDPFPRQQTGSNGIYGLDVDNNGYVYVCIDTTTGVTEDLKVYRPISTWTPGGHTDAPITTINLPDGVYKGVAVNANGSAIFISDYANRKVIKYTGSPATGYTLAPGFSFSLGPQDTISGTPPKNAGPIGLAHLPSKNILAVVSDSLLKATGVPYGYGRIYLLNGNTGGLISTDTSMNMIDQAAWNLAISGSYQAQGAGNASGYASTMDVKWDENENLYSQSMYGWTIEKWKYNGTLPSFTTSVEPVEGLQPTGYTLSQNYPNPFNPTTTIEFSLPQSAFVTLKVFDVLGQEVALLANETKAAGTYRATFDAHNIPSGTYFYSLQAGSYSEVKRMVILK